MASELVLLIPNGFENISNGLTGNSAASVNTWSVKWSSQLEVESFRYVIGCAQSVDVHNSWCYTGSEILVMCLSDWKVKSQ